MSTWTQEPWKEEENIESKYEYLIRPNGSKYIIAVVCDGVDGLHNSEFNAARIVACVNACAGIPTECLGDDEWKTLITGRKEREALRASLRDMTEYADLYTASQEVGFYEHRYEYVEQARIDIAKARGLLI
jgi:hypothetical protein